MEVILSINPIDIQVRYEAALATHRLRILGEWDCGTRRTLHQTVLENLPGYHLSNVKCDRVAEQLVLTECECLIPDRGSWGSGEILENARGIHFYTDGSKMDGRTGSGFFSRDLDVGRSYRLPDHNNVFQAEMVAITECMKFVNGVDLSGDITIFTDSQAAVRALSSRSVKTKTILDCKREINTYSCRGRLSLIWVPGHYGMEGNEMADGLARAGATLISVNLDNPRPFRATREELKQWAADMHRERWSRDDVGAVTKVLWGGPNVDKTGKLLRLGKRELAILMGVLTGHSTLRAHLKKMGRSSSSTCRACEEDEETLEHFLCFCPAFARFRAKYWQRDTIPSIECLRGTDVRTLLEFVRDSEFFR